MKSEVKNAIEKEQAKFQTTINAELFEIKQREENYY